VRVITLKTLAAALGIVAITAAASAQGDITFNVEGRPNSTPWVAASGSTVAVAWSVATTSLRQGDIYLAMSADGGLTFGPPVRVNATPGEARINGEIAPRVALQPRRNRTPIVSVTWNAKDAATHIKTARSTDGGRTFTPAVPLQSDAAAGERGWPASSFDSKGTLHTFWLDHREMAAHGAHAMPKGEHDGVAMAQRSGLYYRADGGVERELFKGVCFCCKTAMATGPNDEIYAAWRHVFAGNMRDMGFTVSRDGGKTFSPMVRVNQDGWSIQGCPDDGPAMAVDTKGTIHLVWPTVQSEQGVIQYATSRDGRAFAAPVRMPTLGGRRPSHPQVAVAPSGQVFVAWDESKDGVRSAAIARADGSQPPMLLGPASSYPVMATTATGLIAAWTSGPPAESVIKLRRIATR